MLRANPRENYQAAFARMWPARNEPPRLLPNGRDYTNTRGSLRDNLRAQRQILADVAAGRVRVP